MLEASVPLYPLAVGDLVGGKYRIGSVLGEGGMGVVFTATHVELHRDVALKVIRQELSQQPELVARLMLEARAAAQIKSEHVCRVLDVDRLDSGTPYVVMEYLEGKNLGALLESKGRLTERTAVDYLLQACEAVAEAHRVGVIHRDLKPENLFLAEFPDGRRAIKVLDFGISKVTGTQFKPVGMTLTNPSSAMGSPHYMAPEQMTALRDVDARADIWALGAILHQLVTGRMAFEGDSLPAVCAAVLQSQPVPVRDIVEELSPGLEEAILSCLVKKREQRVNSVSDLALMIASFGSPQARQSAARISRLLDVSRPSEQTVEDSLGTLLSPRQLPTPRTPIQPAQQETVAALTSSKQLSTDVRSVAQGSRKRRYTVTVVLLLFTGLGLATMLSSSSNTGSASTNPTGPGVNAEVAPTAAPKEPEPLPSQGSQVPTPADIKNATSPVSSAIANSLAEEEPSTAQPPTTASAKSAPAQVSVRTHKSNGKHKSNAVDDPYNVDNFGGRR